MKGKNYSTNQKTELRNEGDFYQTPYSLTELLLKNFSGVCCSNSFLDPACGDGAIIKVLKKMGYANSVGSDIKTGFDFLDKGYPMAARWVITNPPFKKFNEFVLKALEVARLGVIMFGKLDFISGKKRFDGIYSKYPPYMVLAFTRKTLLEATIREDGKFKTGIDAVGWFIWYKDHKTYNSPDGTILRLVDNDKYVLRKGDLK